MTYYEYVLGQVTRKRGRGRPPVFVKILKPHVELLEDICKHTLGSIVSKVNSGVKKELPVRLTNLCTKMGRIVEQRIQEELTLDQQMKIGILFVEAALHVGYIDVVQMHYDVEDVSKYNKEKGEWEKVSTTTMVYEVKPGPYFEVKDLTPAVATIPRKIRDIVRLRQGHGRNVIKRWGKDQEEEFQMLLSCDEDPSRPEAFIVAANNLQQTAWRINHEALAIIAGNHWDKFEYELDPMDPNYEIELAKVRDNCVVMSKAIAFSEFDEFYQYVSFDWRGRVYYDEPYFNFQGSDLARGLMLFSVAKPLGSSGLFWLKVHTANSFNMSFSVEEIPEWCEKDYASMLEAQGLNDISVDKMSLNDRARWTEENMDMILKTAKEELLVDCEKPVSFLAACLEWHKVHNWIGTPESFPSALPVGVDGSNNGWQHLGAMLRDEHTGSLVGLTDLEVPKDLYVTVAQRLTELVPEFFDDHSMPMKAIRKGIAKRGTMTKAYSAGAKTMGKNMWADIKQYGFDSKYGITEEDCYDLAKELVNAIKDTCPKPMEGMKVLQAIASELVSGKGDTIKWQSPSGFPVEQQYWVTRFSTVKVLLQPPPDQELHFTPIGWAVKNEAGKLMGYNGWIGLVVHEVTDFPDKKKHAASISPNFVHSQDASHLALVVANWDGPFGAVHDSFSCHACDVEELVGLTKHVFVDLYEDENFFGTLCGDLGVSIDLPEPGYLDIEEVLKSDFFFA